MGIKPGLFDCFVCYGNSAFGWSFHFRTRNFGVFGFSLHQRKVLGCKENILPGNCRVVRKG